MIIESELAYLMSAKNKVLEFIDETPDESVITLASWKAQLVKLNKKIDEIEQQRASN